MPNEDRCYQFVLSVALSYGQRAQPKAVLVPAAGRCYHRAPLSSAHLQSGEVLRLTLKVRARARGSPTPTCGANVALARAGANVSNTLPLLQHHPPPREPAQRQGWPRVQGRPYVVRAEQSDQGPLFVLRVGEEQEEAAKVELVRHRGGPFVGLLSHAAGGRYLQGTRRRGHRLLFFNHNFGANEQWQLGHTPVGPWQAATVTLTHQRFQVRPVSGRLIRRGVVVVARPIA